jgi:ArsR family transcriptional regulator, cadmium/lead-responsive transcriptional repressor
MSNAVTDAPFALADPPTREALLAKYFRGLGDPTRLTILRLLQQEGELAAGEIVERLGLPQATVSTHLGCLRWCGFVVTRRRQRSILYRMAEARVMELITLADGLLDDNQDHVRSCSVISDSRSPR